MSNTNHKRNIVPFGRTHESNTDFNSTTLTLPTKLAKELDIENCKVSMTLLRDFNGHKHLLVSKYHREIIIE